MADYVLVHGAFHGGWCWNRVAPILRRDRHVAWTPTLTGLADRAHVLAAVTGLDTHIADIAGLLKFEDLTDVVLVGHSYGGAIVHGVAARAPSRIAHLVVLDGAVPRPGESMFDLLPPGIAEARRALIEDGLMAPPHPSAFGVTAPADIAWVEARLTPQPASTFEAPIAFDPAAIAPLAKTYIACTGQDDRPRTGSAERAEAAADWTYLELATGHDAMVTLPEALADMLLSLRPA